MGILDAGLMVSLLKHGWQENRNNDWYTVKVQDGQCPDANSPVSLTR
jgi:hypothetical protein